MAQYTINPADGDSILNDFTLRDGSPSGVSVVDDNGVPAIFADRWFPATYSYDPAGQFLDGQIVVKRRSPGNAVNQRAGAALRIQTGEDTCYSSVAISPRSQELFSFVQSTRTSLGGFGSVADNDNYHWTRLEVSGNTIRVRSWDGGPSDEPVAWGIEIQNADITTAGYAGLKARTVSDGYYAWIGIGTNGDPAPTEEPTAGTDNLTANDIESASQVSSPAITQIHSFNGADTESAAQVSDPAIAQAHSLNGAGAESATQVSAPTVEQEHALTATSVESASEVTQPSLSTQSTTDSLSADDVEASSQVSAPTISQTHALAANDTEANSQTSQPSIAQEHGLTATSIESLSEVSQPALQAVAGTDSLAANDVEASSETESPSLAQVHALNPQTVEAGSAASTASVGQVHNLSAQSVSSESSVTNPTLRDASQVLKTPIRNTRAIASQTHYRAVDATPERRVGVRQTRYRIEVA